MEDKSIVDRLGDDLKAAMKARDADRMATLRMAISAMNYRRIERSAALSSEEQEDVVRKQVKQRDDSIEEFSKAGRTDLADKEKREREILKEYLPADLSPAQLQAEVAGIIARPRARRQVRRRHESRHALARQARERQGDPRSGQDRDGRQNVTQRFRTIILVASLVAMVFGAVGLAGAATTRATNVQIVQIDGTINAGMAHRVQRAIDDAKARGANSAAAPDQDQRRSRG